MLSKQTQRINPLKYSPFLRVDIALANIAVKGNVTDANSSIMMINSFPM